MTICFCHLTLFAQNKKIDSLLTLIKTDKPDTNKVKRLNNLCKEYGNIGFYDTAIYYGNSALQLAQQINFKKGVSASYSEIGGVYSDKRVYPKAIDYYSKALQIDEELMDKSGMSVDLGNIGIIYNYKGDYSKALDYYFRALKIREALGNKNGIATNFDNIGGVYYFQGDYQKALDYCFKALKLYEELGNKNGSASTLGNIGAIYGEQKNYIKALDNYLKTLKIAEELGDKQLEANTLGNIGTIYNYQKDYPKVLDYYFKALKMTEELGEKSGTAMFLGNIGVFYKTTGKFKEAEKYYKRAIAINDSIGAMDNLRQVEERLSQLYDTTRQYNLALIHYKKAIALKDTLFSQENKKQLVRKEMNYEFDKKEAITKAVTEAESRRQKIITWSIAFGLLLVVVFAGFIFRSLRVTRKQKQIIEVKGKETEEQKKVIEGQKKIVEEKQKEILDSINYAKRIQQAKLPKKEEIYSALPQSFVLFKPKDIVSGDFYFFSKNNTQIFIAAADCTGHGVPGAFMSMIGSEKLEDAVSQTTDTSEILKLLNKGIKTSLHQSEINESTRDGMDIALCSVDTENRIVKYAGANRPMWLIRKGQSEVEETKATKKAIGGFTEDEQHFDTQEIKLQQGDTFYISTDGYADQFGGAEGKKLMTKKFKEILLDIQDKTMQEQEKYLDTFLDNWRGNKEQIDDILVIGIRL